ncbi:septum site-determining protein MinC [Halocella sp. SP3-1]|uniref:septum site-determining protein MinC n=1 Tax=Halocella sp. SP3-1 TaxID=2382161 RepID=UPI000F755BB2|nr:septum site-determining protein MinC [Halocella sp. SP3-1]AZO94311.1 septum site-determining protein MinC [Halocella sp. SP3-1]
MREAVSFRVSSKGVIINFNSQKSFEEIKEALLNRIEEAGDFFAGIDLYINQNDCIFSLEEMKELINILEKYKRVDNIYFLNEKSRVKPRTMDTILINRTIRSGQRIKYPANIVVIGDINPGAEVIAGGDILVIGKLRGVVHAGASGSMESQVIALKLQPTQLRIGTIISRSPDDKRFLQPVSPERAYIKDGIIIVEELQLK